MPLHKHVEHDDDDQRQVAQFHAFSPFAGFAEAGWAAIEYVTVGLWGKGKAWPQLPGVPRVGKYYADYSELTPGEIAAPDAERDALFNRSKPVSR
jgi:hypothetical protein